MRRREGKEGNDPENDGGTNCRDDSEEEQIARTTETDDYLARVRTRAWLRVTRAA